MSAEIETVPDERTESDNDAALGWPLDPGSPGREVWYGLVSHPEQPIAFWFRYTMVSTTDGHQEARCWAAITDRDSGKASTFATRTEALETVDCETKPFRLAFGDDVELRDDRARGVVTSDRGSIEWDLSYQPDEFVFTPLRSPRVTAFASRVLGAGQHWSANESVRMSGTVTVGDRQIALDEAFGHQGHTVGRDPPSQWNWVHCNEFDADGVVVEALDVDGLLSICLRTPEQNYLLNRLGHILHPRRNKTVDSAPGTWEFRGRGDGAELRCTVRADTDHWQRAAYLCPDGTKRYNAHCSLSALELSFRTKGAGGWTEWQTTTTDRARAEWVDTEAPISGEYRPHFSDELDG